MIQRTMSTSWNEIMSKLVSATEPISDSPAGIMVKSMLTGMAEYYSAELSEKVARHD